MFNYKCPECGKGIVKPTKIKNYKTKKKGIAYVVPYAIIGICNNCNTNHFNAKETKRWDKFF